MLEKATLVCKSSDHHILGETTWKQNEPPVRPARLPQKSAR